MYCVVQNIQEFDDILGIFHNFVIINVCILTNKQEFGNQTFHSMVRLSLITDRSMTERSIVFYYQPFENRTFGCVRLTKFF